MAKRRKDIFLHKEIPIPIYFGTLVVMRLNNWQELRERFPEQQVHDGFAAVVFEDIRRDDDTTYYVVAFNGEPTGALIAHEVVHLVSQVYLGRGMRKDATNDEPEAYLTGWMFQQIEGILKENG